MLFKDYTLFGAKHLTMSKRIGSGNAVSNYLLQTPLTGGRFVNFGQLTGSGPFPSEYDTDFETPDYHYTWIGYANFRFGLPGITVQGNQINLRIHKFPKIIIDSAPRTMVQLE